MDHEIRIGINLPMIDLNQYFLKNFLLIKAFLLCLTKVDRY